MEVEGKGRRLWFDVDGPALVPEGLSMRERPTVVLLHGGPGSFDHSYFKPDFARLAEVAQVVYLDLPGHGRSEWGDPAAWSFEEAADAVRDFCDAVGIERPVVLGHSLGGCVAMLYAARHPAHPSKLVLQSTFARFDLDGIVEGFRGRWGDDVAATIARAYGPGAGVSSEEWERVWRLFGRWVPGDVERARTVANPGLNAAARGMIRGFDAVDRIGAIACPTLVCTGELDPITPPAAARELAGAIPAARVELVAGAGHFPWRDEPERYWPPLLAFLDV